MKSRVTVVTSNQFNQVDKLGPKRITVSRSSGRTSGRSCKLCVFAVSTQKRYPAESDILKAASKIAQGLGKPLPLSENGEGIRKPVSGRKAGISPEAKALGNVRDMPTGER